MNDVAAEIQQYRERLATPEMTAGEFNDLLPEHLRVPYWEMKLDELFSRRSGNRQRIGGWADLVYLRRGGVTHVLPFSVPVYGTRMSSGSALCDRSPGLFEEWLGTGSQSETDKARCMPLCIRCMQMSRGRTR